MNMRWCSLKTDCTIKGFIPKLFENTIFCNSNITHGHTNNYQVTSTFMDNQPYGGQVVEVGVFPMVGRGSIPLLGIYA